MDKDKSLEDKELHLKQELSQLANDKGSLTNPDVVKKSQELDQVLTTIQENNLKNKSGR
ncbi:aspartyl-phosphate phosphatase Spo0E family protein [Fictibacillus phosphorivorans]|uniref:aspartyl-phosphate phosphatase Spo0E family protein n=1 Tax=Fictibacillus phosphorivorans TaxID=1221500 RepID=UPI0012936D34|nr:aspartyl-phosphate phosphatase Spo0E family protein [Fictibacillus phosphorivorans]MQR94507.1 aspartyl-phosphate phosphatase Spo0E family protein [Fictibacillus phosphorivorans]